MNGGNPRENLIQHKNPKLAMKLAPEWKELGLNHLEGRTAGFSPMATVLRRRETNGPTAVFAPPQILRPEEEPLHRFVAAKYESNPAIAGPTPSSGCAR